MSDGLTQQVIDEAAALLRTPLRIGDIVWFEDRTYPRMMYVGTKKHSVVFLTSTGYIHEEPRPVKKKFKVIGKIDFSELIAADAVKE